MGLCLRVSVESGGFDVFGALGVFDVFAVLGGVDVTGVGIHLP